MEEQPSPGRTVSLHDAATGLDYQLPVEDRMVRARDLGKVDLGHGGLVSYDPGLVNTAPCRSAICYIDGDQGVLSYRGYPIEELAEQSHYLEVAWLLHRGELPSADELAGFVGEIQAAERSSNGLLELFDAFPRALHPMRMMQSALAALGGAYPDSSAVQDPRARWRQILRLLAMTPQLAAACWRRRSGLPRIDSNPALSYAGNLLHMLLAESEGADRLTPEMERAMDALLVLHADHEQNCSTFAVRSVGSSRVDPYSSVAAGVAALFGPLHGGANQAVLEMIDEIGSADAVPRFLDSCQRGERRLMGFGHRVYKSYDPRAKIIKELAHRAFAGLAGNPRLEIAQRLESIALEDEYFRSRRLYPNVDFYSGLLYDAMGFDPEMFTVFFAVGRMAGWLAHWNEMFGDPEQRIVRPSQIYTGPARRSYPKAGSGAR